MPRLDRRLILFGTGMVMMIPLLFYGSYMLVSSLVAPAASGELPRTAEAATQDEVATVASEEVVVGNIKLEPDPLLLPELAGSQQPAAPVQEAFVMGALDALPANATACDRVVAAALTTKGKPYSQGGHLQGDPVDATSRFLPRNGPNSFDCSGMVWWSYMHGDMKLGSVAAQQAKDGAHIDCTLDDLNGAQTTCWERGDLLFLDYTGRAAGDHVAMYVGDGLFMNCANHDVGCGLHDVSRIPSYREHFWQARRIIKDCAQGTPASGPPMPLPSTPGTSLPSGAGEDRPTLRLGHESDDVRELQQLLNVWLATIPELPIERLLEDGKFGAKTETMVRQFQQSTGLMVDGVVGPATWTNLLLLRDANDLLTVAEAGELVAGQGAVARTKPSRDSAEVQRLDNGDPYLTTGYTDYGQAVEGSARWYQLQSGDWVHSSGGSYREGSSDGQPSPSASEPPDNQPSPGSSGNGEKQQIIAEVGVLVAVPGAVARSTPSREGDITQYLDNGTAHPTSGYTDHGQVVEGSARWYQLQSGDWVHSSGGSYWEGSTSIDGDTQGDPSSGSGSTHNTQPSPSASNQEEVPDSSDGASDGSLNTGGASNSGGSTNDSGAAGGNSSDEGSSGGGGVSSDGASGSGDSSDGGSSNGSDDGSGGDGSGYP